MERFWKLLKDDTAWIVSGGWTVFQLLAFVFTGEKVFDNRVTKVLSFVLLLVFVVGLICRLISQFRSKKIKIKTSEGNVIELVKCDICSLFSKNEYAFAFSTSNFFNTDEKLIEKEVLRLYLEHNKSLWININQAIQQSLANEQAVIINNPAVTLGGNNKSYPIGTVAQVDHNLYLMAVTEIKASEGSFGAKSNKEFLNEALNNLWKKLIEQERQNVICMPAIGSGHAKVFSQQSTAIKFICNSFIAFQKNSGKKICEKLVIVANDRRTDLVIVSKCVQLDNEC